MKIESAKKYTAQPGDVPMIKITGEGKVLCVPTDPNNRHYQEIQDWVAEGNKVEEAD